MAKAFKSKSPELRAHLEWLGYVQPVGLVVSIPALLESQCYVNKNIPPEHNRFLACLPRDAQGNVVSEIHDLTLFCQQVLDWEATDLVAIPKQPQTEDQQRLEVVLPQYNETLRPTHAVPAFEPTEGQNPWLMLVEQLPSDIDLDENTAVDSAKHWSAAPQAKFERLLRETDVPIGLLTNGRQLRLVYSPRGESSGHATFNVDEMTQVAGRPMFAALHMLLCAERLFSLGEEQRLPAILENSRKYQNTVSTKLAEQVLAALYELMRGFQAANDARQGELLREILASDPNHVYSGLLTVLMRLVFVMYAEDRDLLSSEPVYSNHYSVTGLFNRLREDAGRFPDTMDQRFGAWSQLVTLFRLVYDGGQHGEFHIPPRKGYLFDPDRYPFLEGRQRDDSTDDSPVIPRVSDGVVFRVLSNLLVLDGERLSYRTLDVEQIGSVYETVMGFNLEVAAGKSIAIKPVKSHGAPATVNLEALLETVGKDRAKWLKEQADQKLSTADAKLLKAAESIDDLLAALDKKIAKQVTPRVVPSGAIVLQPSDERRRSGSHYTPRSLTEPIVRTTLEPILKQLVDAESKLPEVPEPTAADRKRYTKGELAERTRLARLRREYADAGRQVGTPHPSQILDLKVCDPAMGSGAFLVETCRQLGDELIKSWYAHDLVPTDIPPDEDEVLYARRLVAQRCLYGVDKNVMAVDLAKLSLWLVTLAKDHAFTFLDHALRHGDSLVGLTRQQIIGFHWDVKKQKKFGEDLIQRRLDRATEARAKILNAREDVPYRDQEQRLALANEALNVVRLTGDACVSAFFAGSKKKERETRCDELFADIAQLYQNLKEQKLDADVNNRLQAVADSLQNGEHPVPAFHWEIEFPEVFSRENGGFDAFVGNPPFAGKNTMIASNRDGMLDWLKSLHPESHGNSDLVAHFYRRAFSLLRGHGTFGLIATNTIAQGDTRVTGLRWICVNEGCIYNARTRVRWPGVAAVVVSVVHISRGPISPPYRLDGKPVDLITAYLFYAGDHESPPTLRANAGKSFQGVIPLGMGFTFDDDNDDATPLSVMHQLIDKDSRNQERIFPFIGWDEVANNPQHSPNRYIINFGDRTEDQARQWPDLMEIVERKVKPGRYKQKDKTAKEFWWRYLRPRAEMHAAIDGLNHVIVTASQAMTRYGIAYLPNEIVYSSNLTVIADSSIQTWGVMQSQAHETWARFFCGTLKDDLAYAPTDGFDNFPFPDQCDVLEGSAHNCLQGRAKIMIKNQEGLTDTYNRFHSPDERDEGILELRRLHGQMDDAVLRAYGWDDLADKAVQPDYCQFLLDYEEEEDEEPGARKSKKKKPWRYRWPDDFRDEVLARLLELNQQRYEEEQLAGQQLEAAKEAKPKKKRDKKADDGPGLFDHEVDLQEEDRVSLIVVAAWGEETWVDRLLFGQSLLLWKNNKHRQHLLGLGDEPQRRTASIGSIPQLIGRAINNGWIESRDSDSIQFLRLAEKPSPVGNLSTVEKKKVEEIKDVVKRIADSEDGVIEQTDLTEQEEGSIRATKEFV